MTVEERKEILDELYSEVDSLREEYINLQADLSDILSNFQSVMGIRSTRANMIVPTYFDQKKSTYEYLMKYVSKDRNRFIRVRENFTKKIELCQDAIDDVKNRIKEFKNKMEIELILKQEREEAKRIKEAKAKQELEEQVAKAKQKQEEVRRMKAETEAAQALKARIIQEKAEQNQKKRDLNNLKNILINLALLIIILLNETLRNNLNSKISSIARQFRKLVKKIVSKPLNFIVSNLKKINDWFFGNY